MCTPPSFAAFPQYQGGLSFTVFSAQGSNPAVNCKISGKSVHKIYDKSVKGYVYSCSGGMSSKIQFPKDDSKTGLQLVQPYLVLQLFVPKGQHFSLELRATDTHSTRRKMYFSTSFSELKATPLHCQIPLSVIMRNTWISLALHVPDLFHSCFRVLSFRSLDVIIVGPVCKLRKIFTMRNRLAQSVMEVKDNEECLPLEHTFAAGVEASIQVIDTQKLQNLVGTASNLEGRRGIGSAPVLGARKLYPNKLDRHVNVAFGSRMPLPLSTVRINTNLPHDVNCVSGNDEQAHHQASTTEIHSRAYTSKVSEPVPCPPPQTRTASSGTERQPEMKALNPKAFNHMGPPPMWDSAIFPVQEESHVDTLETDPIVIDKCPDLISKQGQKLQKLSRRREEKIRKWHQVVRHSQKENSSLNKVKETKELDVNGSPPGSPPSGWANNSNGGSDSFLFDQQFDKDLWDFDTPGALRDRYETVSRSFGDSTNFLEAFCTSVRNGCALDDEESLLEKGISCSGRGPSPTLYANGVPDWPADVKASGTLPANEQKTFHDQSNHPQELEEAETQASDNLLRASVDGLKENTKTPSKISLISKKLTDPGRTLEHNGPFGSTEELWIVHEEADFSEASPSVFDTAREEETSQVKRTGATKAVAGKSTSVSSSSCCIKQSAFDKIPENDFPSKQQNSSAFLVEKTKPVLLDPKKPMHSKIDSHSLESDHKDRELDLLYDPILDCYYDPKTNRYYELK